MHCGRVANTVNLPAGAKVVGPTDAILTGEIYTDAKGMQPHSQPHALTEQEIADAVREYANSATLAINAGFDAVELHGANGYLIEQFLNGNVNTRQDGYSVAEVSARLGVSAHSLYKWVKAVTPDRSEQQSKELLDAKHEILRLRAQMRRVEEERDLLKKAARYFAKEPE